MRALAAHPGLLPPAFGQSTVPATDKRPPQNVSRFLSGDVRSDMHNAKSALMYAAEMCRSQVDEAGKKKGMFK